MRTLLLISTLLLTATFAGAVAQADQPNAANIARVKAMAPDEAARRESLRYPPLTKEVEITGEVVDAWCFTSQVMGPGRGESHKACGLACAYGGVTLGIVDDKGTLFIAAKHKGFQGCKELLTPFMAKRVKVDGWLASKGGCNVLKIKSVQEVKPGTGKADAMHRP
jgi:hypothetical protein